jgi:hypothetical protein
VARIHGHLAREAVAGTRPTVIFGGAHIDGQGARRAVADAASQAAQWATPRAEAAIEWVTPRAQAAWRQGVAAAAPRVEEAARLLSPKIDIARDKLKEQVLPAIVAAVNHAAEVAAQSASDVAHTSPAVTPVAAPKKHRLRKALGWSALIAALGAVAYAIWARREPDSDPWSEDDAWGGDAVAFVPTSQGATSEPDDPGLAGAAKEGLNDLADAAGVAADAVGEKAGEAVRKVSSAGKKAAAAAQATLDKAKKAAEAAAEKIETDQPEEA